MRVNFIILFIVIVTFPLQIFSQNEEINISMYPKPEIGYKRHLINLEQKKNEQEWQVEFYIGKMIPVDLCNSFSFVGKIEKRELTGWGYIYYVFNTKGQIMSSKRGCSDAFIEEKFITCQSQFTRYNSRIPILVYVPDGYEVRYRIWNAGKKEYLAEKY